jgi:hypothetical protein
MEFLMLELLRELLGMLFIMLLLVPPGNTFDPEDAGNNATYTAFGNATGYAGRSATSPGNTFLIGIMLL